MKRCAVMLVRGPGKSYLIGKRRDNGKLTFPAGHLNEGEDPKAGAIRELKEETGFDALDVISKGVFEDRPGVMIYVYEAKVSNKPNLENDPDQEFQSLFYKDPNSISYNEWHIKPEYNCGLRVIRGK